MELFLSMAGDDMENIRMELEKLISSTLGREVITVMRCPGRSAQYR